MGKDRVDMSIAGHAGVLERLIKDGRHRRLIFYKGNWERLGITARRFKAVFSGLRISYQKKCISIPFLTYLCSSVMP